MEILANTLVLVTSGRGKDFMIEEIKGYLDLELTLREFAEAFWELYYSDGNYDALNDRIITLIGDKDLLPKEVTVNFVDIGRIFENPFAIRVGIEDFVYFAPQPDPDDYEEEGRF